MLLLLCMMRVRKNYLFLSLLVLFVHHLCTARRIIPSDLLSFDADNISYSNIESLPLHGRKLATAADHKIIALPGLSVTDADSAGSLKLLVTSQNLHRCLYG
jgi:hypothetical protein